MAYKIIGGAYFEETPQGLAAVADSTTLSKLRSGEIQAQQGTLGSAPVAQPTGLTQSAQQSFQNTLKGTMNTGAPESGAPQSRGTLMDFASALQNVSELIRQKRNEAGLGVVADVTPRGGLPNFSGILGTLNQAGSQYTEGLTSAALKAHEADIAREEEKKANLQNLALSASKAGASADVINSILQSDNIDDAIRASSGVFAKSGQNVLSTTTRTDAMGNKYADVLMMKPDGSFETKSVLLGRTAPETDVFGLGDTSAGLPSFDEWKSTQGAQDILTNAQNQRMMSFTAAESDRLLREEYSKLASQQPTEPQGPLAGLEDTQIKTLQSLGLAPHQMTLVAGIARGESPPINPNNPRTKELQMTLGGLAAIGFDNTKAWQDWTEMQKRITTMSSQSFVRLENSIRALEGSTDQAERLFAEWQSSGLPTGFSTWNKAALEVSARLPGSAGVASRTLLSHIEDMSNELSVVYRLGNTPTDKALESAAKSLQADWNAEQFAKNLELIRQNMRIRINSLRLSSDVPSNIYNRETPTLVDVYGGDYQSLSNEEFFNMLQK
jgi:hypothetical protein